jgi:hypothetical protein
MISALNEILVRHDAKFSYSFPAQLEIFFPPTLSMAAAFDDPRRSNASLLLANIIAEGLLTAEELKQFNQEAQARIKIISELRGA